MSKRGYDPDNLPDGYDVDGYIYLEDLPEDMDPTVSLDELRLKAQNNPRDAETIKIDTGSTTAVTKGDTLRSNTPDSEAGGEPKTGPSAVGATSKTESNPVSTSNTASTPESKFTKGGSPSKSLMTAGGSGSVALDLENHPGAIESAETDTNTGVDALKLFSVTPIFTTPPSTTPASFLKESDEPKDSTDTEIKPVSEASSPTTVLDSVDEASDDETTPDEAHDDEAQPDGSESTRPDFTHESDSDDALISTGSMAAVEVDADADAITVPIQDVGSVPIQDVGSVPTQDVGSVPTQDVGSVPTQDPDSMPTQDPDSMPTQNPDSIVEKPKKPKKTKNPKKPKKPRKPVSEGVVMVVDVVGKVLAVAMAAAVAYAAYMLRDSAVLTGTGFTAAVVGATVVVCGLASGIWLIKPERRMALYAVLTVLCAAITVVARYGVFFLPTSV